MNRFLKWALAGVLVFGVVHGLNAAWNIQQNDDGTAQWVNDKGDTHPIGSIYLTTFIDNISSASTVAVVVPITGARLSAVRTVLWGAITSADATLDFWHTNSSGVTEGSISDALGANRITGNDGTNYVGTLVIDFEDSGRGAVDTFTVSNASPRRLERGSVIYIHTDGGSSTSASAAVILTIERDR